MANRYNPSGLARFEPYELDAYGNAWPIEVTEPGEEARALIELLTPSVPEIEPPPSGFDSGDAEGFVQPAPGQELPPPPERARESPGIVPAIGNPRGNRGKIQPITGTGTGPGLGTFTHVAELEFDNPDQSMAFTIHLSSDTAPGTTGGTGPPNTITPLANQIVQWYLEWGYGGITFSRILNAQGGRVTVSGNTVRVAARLIDRVLQVPSAPSVNALCRAMIVPAHEAGQRLSSIWSAVAVTGSAILVASPMALMRLSGFVRTAGAFPRWIQTFDSVSVPADGATPLLNIDVPAADQTYSEDDLLSAQDYGQGLVVCASSTPFTKTLDAAATFWARWEQLF